MPNSNFPVITYPYGGTGLQVLGTPGQVLGTDGTQILWATVASSGGTVTNIATGAGLTGGPITTTGTISAVQTNLTDAGTDGIVITNGTNAVFGTSPVTLSQHVADTTHNGYLSSTDWNTFNSKQATLTIGALDAQAANSTGLAFVSNVLSTQSADASNPGMVNNTTQTFSGLKTFNTNTVSLNFTSNITSTASSGSPLVLTNASTRVQIITGTTNQTIKLPAANTLTLGTVFEVSDNSTGTVSVDDNASTLLSTIPAGGYGIFRVTDISTAAGTWDRRFLMPSNASYGTTAMGVSGTLSASNLFGTNSGDVTIGTANGLSLSTQILSLQAADTTHTGALTSTDWNTFNSKQSALTTGNLTDVGTDGIVITGGTGAVIGTGTTIAQTLADASHNGYLSSTDWSTFNGKQASGSYITALTGDVTASGPGSVAATLATVNTNTGSFGSSTSIPSFTVNGKGLITAAAGNAVVAPAGTLSGTTLNSTVVSSSLTSVGTITSGTWTGTTIAIANGGTGQTTKTAAFDALQPMTTGGDIIYGGASGTGTRLANGSAGQVLTSNGTTLAPSWTTAGTGTVTSVAMTVPSILAVSGSPITTSGTLAITLANANGNLVFCGPPSGSALAPTFRTLRTRDLPWPPPIYQSGGGTYTLPTLASSIFTNPTIVNTANLTVVLPTPSSTFAGFQYLIMNQDAHSVVASTSVVVPLGSTTAGTAILPATAGKWVILCCDSTNWVVIAGN